MGVVADDGEGRKARTMAGVVWVARALWKRPRGWRGHGGHAIMTNDVEVSIVFFGATHRHNC
jgi:hypothetical protein